MSIPAWETSVMGTSSTTHPTVAEYRENPYMVESSGITKSLLPKTDLAFDAHVLHQDDISHDTLMGLQELDSHLAIFEGNATPGKGSSTTGPLSDIISDEFHIPNDVPSYSHVDSSENLGAHLINERTSSLNFGVGHPKAAKVNGMLKASRYPHTNESNRLRDHDMGSSMSSISISEPDMNSSHTSVSSKGASPADFEISREVIKPSNHQPESSSQQSESNVKPRQKYNVQPKVSIPKDLALEEYARQCIAAAESSRLNPFGLHSEEHHLLRPHLSHAQVTTYLNLRNGILRLWVRNPLIGVLQDEAVGCAKDVRWFDVANICYEWLVRRGYINYGCVENIGARAQPRRPHQSKRRRKTVAVIGAGMSGLGCARQLEGLFSQFEDRFRERGEEPPIVIILEGRDRIGGRIYSHGLKTDPEGKMMSSNMSRRTAEMGGMIITGFDRGNPLNIIVRQQLALPYHALRPTMSLYDVSGSEVNQRRDDLAEKLYNDILERVSDYKFKVPPPHIIEGDRELLEIGRDLHGDNSKTIKDVEDALAGVTSFTNGSTVSMPPKENSLSSILVSSDRPTGRPYVELGVPASHTAAFEAGALGWDLKDGVDDSEDLDLAAAVNAKGATLGSVMDEAISQFKKIVHILPLDLRLMNWHIANLEYSNAINYGELSLGGWDVDAGNEWEGKHTMIIGGYQQVPRGLLHCPQPLNVRKKSVVKRIMYSPDGDADSHTTRIECEDGHTVNADYIISSIPLGVLKQNNPEFEPPLPEWKKGAIERVGFGILNKVVLVYEKPFWDQSRDIFGVLREPIHRASLDQKDYSTNRGRFFQWFNVTKTSGVPTLLALMAGDAAFHTEVSSDHELITEATSVLRTVYGPNIPQPSESLVTRWGHDKFARGSYSYTGPNFRPDDYEVMAKPIGNLFFTGEHTCGTHPATVHGAYISGLRAASDVLEAMLGPIAIPEPLVLPKDNLKRKASETARQESHDPKQARLEAYEIKVWNAIYKELGDIPLRPQKISANPYILFSKVKFEEARKKCEEGRRPSKGRPVPNEVRNLCSKMWKEASTVDKQPFLDRAAAQKTAYAAAVAEYTQKAIRWDSDALAFRKAYEAAHPSVPGPEEREEVPDTPSRRDRRAKRVSGYAENSDSDMDSDL